MYKLKKAKKYKLTIDVYDLPLYDSKIAVIKYPDAKKVFKRFGIPEENIENDWKKRVLGCSYGGGTDKKTGDYLLIIMVFPHTNNANLVNTCAHEALHAAQDILGGCGMKLSDESGEAFAYLVGWIAECIYKTATKK